MLVNVAQPSVRVSVESDAGSLVFDKVDGPFIALAGSMIVDMLRHLLAGRGSDEYGNQVQ
ncbi:MAG TPA: hypothetical protein VHX16_07720 [Chloroflexota bacterium]|nr:hypothetical protein [Chloroflexota bacterium]